MSGSNFTVGGGNPPSAAPGGKSPVLLGLNRERFYFQVHVSDFKVKAFNPGQRIMVACSKQRK